MSDDATKIVSLTVTEKGYYTQVEETYSFFEKCFTVINSYFRISE